MIVGYSRTFAGAGQTYLPSTDYVNDLTTDPADADARWSVFLSGLWYHFSAGVNTSQGSWLLSGVNSDYEVRATEISQSGTGTRTGTLNTWMVMSSDRTWRVVKSSGTGIALWDLTIEIRRVSDSVVISTCTVTIEVEVEL